MTSHILAWVVLGQYILAR